MAARSIVALPSAARTATTNTDVLYSPVSLVRGLTVILDLTVRGAAETITFAVQMLDPASGKFFNLHAAVVTGAVGTYTVVIDDANVATYVGHGLGTFVGILGPVPPQLRVNLVHSGTTAHTYSLGVHFS